MLWPQPREGTGVCAYWLSWELEFIPLNSSLILLPSTWLVFHPFLLLSSTGMRTTVGTDALNSKSLPQVVSPGDAHGRRQADQSWRCQGDPWFSVIHATLVSTAGYAGKAASPSISLKAGTSVVASSFPLPLGWGECSTGSQTKNNFSSYGGWWSEAHFYEAQASLRVLERSALHHWMICHMLKRTKHRIPRASP